MFGKKQIAKLQQEINNHIAIIKNQTNDINRLEASELQLMVQIRETDQLIFQMSQCTDWNQMRPLFLKLKAPVDRRMNLESDRIKTLLIPEMQKAYRS